MVGLLAVAAADAGDLVIPDAGFHQQRERVHETRPKRLDGPLRAVNISDIEVRQVEAAAQSIYPGSLVNIAGVTAGCPCEDGPRCSAQVWVVAHRGFRSRGLMLSMVDDEWVIGPVQRWWLNYEAWRERRRADDRRLSQQERMKWMQDFLAEEQRLLDEFPYCPDET